MVQTQALMSAVLALAGPTPPAEQSPEPHTEVPSPPDEHLRFVHPVQTNPYQPPAPPPPYRGSPPRRSGGGGGGGGGGEWPRTPRHWPIQGQMNGVTRGANGGLGQTLPPGWTETPTTPTNPDETTDPTTNPTPWLEQPADTATTPGTSPVQVDDLPPTTGEPPTANPEPGTLVLAGIGLIAGGGAVVRKWRRRR